jgi:hypothetical protein
MVYDSARAAQLVGAGQSVVFTYDVIWKESQVEWASRWDVYLSNNHPVANSVATLVQYYQLVVDCNTNHLYGGHDFVPYPEQRHFPLQP